MFEVRPCADQEEYSRAIGAIGQYFNPPPSEEFLEELVPLLPHERMHAALEDGAIVGGAGAYPFELSVPGGSLPCAGVTAVGVQPTHRRRGVLRSMMDAQLRDVHERGEPIAALWASEETIYGRFGYGLASWAGELNVPHEWDAFAEPLEPAGRARFVTPEEALELFPPVYDAGAPRAAGDDVPQRAVVGDPAPARRRRREERAAPLRRVRRRRRDAGLRDLPHLLRLRGRSARVAARRARGARHDAAGDRGALALPARRRLDVRRRGAVRAAGSSAVPPARRCRAGRATGCSDGLWVRLVDLPAALSGRAYGEGGPLVLEVRDAICDWNDGRWRLDGGTCERTDAEADLALDVSALGSAYLGAVSFTQLRDVARVQELSEGAVRRADALFAWHPLPWCPEIF